MNHVAHPRMLCAIFLVFTVYVLRVPIFDYSSHNKFDCHEASRTTFSSAYFCSSSLIIAFMQHRRPIASSTAILKLLLRQSTRIQRQSEELDSLRSLLAELNDLAKRKDEKNILTWQIGPDVLKVGCYSTSEFS
jgi:hypothetical protein